MSDVIPFPPGRTPKRYRVVIIEDIHSRARFVSIISSASGPYSTIATAEAEAQTYAKREGLVFRYFRGAPELPK